MCSCVSVRLCIHLCLEDFWISEYFVCLVSSRQGLLFLSGVSRQSVFVFVQFSCTANVTLSTVKRHPVVAHSLPQNGNKYPWPQETTYNLVQICPSNRTIVFLLSEKFTVLSTVLKLRSTCKEESGA